jgi:hypothetical protein
MDKRYQVFVSSTYADLREERQEVIQALLELDCIPAGMELFPAADDDQWTLIRKVIDDCDYYLVIIAGRYGSLGPNGKSYTQMEYEYAVEQRKPIIAFLHENPGQIPSDHTEQSPDGKTSLQAFRELVKRKTCRFWSSQKDLGSAVSRSVVKLIKAKPGVGWVRADLVPSEASAHEILRLKRKVEELQAQLAQTRMQPPTGTESLSQGAETIALTFNATVAIGEKGDQKIEYYRATVDLSWNEILACIGPLMIDKATENRLRYGLERYFKSYWGESIVVDRSGKSASSDLLDKDFRTIIVQLRALGVITMSIIKTRATSDRDTYWSLTACGKSPLLGVQTCDLRNVWDV